jgi:hypothetical protein
VSRWASSRTINRGIASSSRRGGMSSRNGLPIRSRRPSATSSCSVSATSVGWYVGSNHVGDAAGARRAMRPRGTAPGCETGRGLEVVFDVDEEVV